MAILSRLFPWMNNNKAKPTAVAVIVAAGQGTRMREAVPSKQLAIVEGTPVIALTLSAFEQAQSIRKVILVVRQEDMLEMIDIVKGYEFSKVSKIIAGGQTRQESVKIGVSETVADDMLIAVHDGARPMVRPQDIDNVVEAASQHGAAALGVPLKDTVKEVDESGSIIRTVDRSRLFAVQTPQVFERELLMAGLSLAMTKRLDFTDDCQLVEHMGRKVQMVTGSYDNIKVTTPEDLSFLSALIGGEGEWK